jgi:hypothetical protein
MEEIAASILEQIALPPAAAAGAPTAPAEPAPPSPEPAFPHVFLVCNLPAFTNLDMLTAAVLHATSDAADVHLVLGPYGRIGFTSSESAQAFLIRTQGCLWVYGSPCHLVTCSLNQLVPLPWYQGTYAHDALYPHLMVDLERACFYDLSSEMYLSAVTDKTYRQDAFSLAMVPQSPSAAAAGAGPIASGGWVRPDAALQPCGTSNNNSGLTASAPPTSQDPPAPATLAFFVAPHSKRQNTVVTENWRPDHHADEEAPSGPGHYVCKTDSKPACRACRLKFASLADLRRHEASSMTHREKTAPWVDRAKLRRLTADPNGHIIVTARDALETPLDLRDANNKGAAMMRKMGWSHGQGLGAEGQGVTRSW